MKINFKGWIAKGLNRLAKVLSGDAMLTIGLDRHLGLVCYGFLLFSAIIAWSLTVESDMVKVKNNEKKLEGLRIYYHQAELNYVGMDSRSTVNRMLVNYNSKLHAPSQPPGRIILKRQKVQDES